MKLYHLKK